MKIASAFTSKHNSWFHFLWGLGLFCLLICLPQQSKAQSHIYCTAANKVLCESHLNALAEHSLGKKPIGEIAIEVGTRFLGTPYEGKTLEQGDTEKLVVNVSGLDCTTFLENVVVMSRLAKIDQCDFEDFLAELEHIRYRDGELQDYPSRLHYFTEWISNNEAKGIIKNITSSIGGETYAKKIDFMSTHRSAYAQLAVDSFYHQIIEIEKNLNQKSHHYIPKEKLASVEKGIQNGDLIAITTSIGGLDISHTGIAIEQNGRIHLLHASTGSKQVEVSEKPLADYLIGNKRQNGIMVARLQ